MCSFVKGLVGTGLAVFLVEQATQARRHKTKLHSSSANSLYAKPSWAITLASELHCVRQGVPKRPLAILPERRPIVCLKRPLFADLPFEHHCADDVGFVTTPLQEVTVRDCNGFRGTIRRIAEACTRRYNADTGET